MRDGLCAGTFMDVKASPLVLSFELGCALHAGFRL
jgi:hypothetical protein